VTLLGAVGDVLAGAVRRRAAEEDAESTHRALAAVIEGTTDYVFVKDLDGRIIAVGTFGTFGVRHRVRAIASVKPRVLQV
jgi:hypothetical protein